MCRDSTDTTYILSGVSTAVHICHALCSLISVLLAGYETKFFNIQTKVYCGFVTRSKQLWGGIRLRFYLEMTPDISYLCCERPRFVFAISLGSKDWDAPLLYGSFVIGVMWEIFQGTPTLFYVSGHAELSFCLPRWKENSLCRILKYLL